MKKKSSRYTDIVQVDDVLQAMAESLVERQPKSFKPTLTFKDKPAQFKLGGRPPREIFYRQTALFLTKLPPPVQEKLCSCRYLCSGAMATIKCHSCSIFEPSGSAFFCTPCFRIRHPWHRIPHVYTSIEKDESIEHTLKVAHRIAEAKRYEQEGSSVLKSLMNEKSRLAEVADDEKLDNKIWEYGRRMVALEEHVARLRRKMHEDSYQHSLRKSLVMDSSDYNVLKQMQQSEQLREILDSFYVVKRQKEEYEQDLQKRQNSFFVYDPDSHLPEGSESVGSAEEVVVVDAADNLSLASSVPPEPSQLPIPPSSSSPAIEAPQGEVEPSMTAEEGVEVEKEAAEEEGKEVEEEEKEEIEVSQEETTPATECMVVMDPQSSAAVLHIQKVFKGFLARRIVSSMLAARIVKVWSPQYSRDYYYDRVSGESSWIVSKLLREEHMEELAYVSESPAVAKWTCKGSTTEKKKKRSSTVSVVRAIRLLQNFARCVLARKRLIQRANNVYRRVLDEESGSWYYANIVTGRTSWEKPSFYLSHEPPVLLPEEISRRSPRFQRMSAEWKV